MNETSGQIFEVIARVFVLFALGLFVGLFAHWWRTARAARRELQTMCRYCGGGGPMCGNIHRDGHVCTRDLGHKGRCVACTARKHRVKEWGGKAKTKALI